VRAICEELVRRNEPARTAADGDYLLTMQASRGMVGDIYGPGDAVPTVTAYCLPLAFAAHARYYRNGAPVIVTATRRTPPESLSPRAKVSNKMNHFQAEFEAKATDPGAFALMLDTDGNIAESSGSDFLFISNGVLRIPQRRTHLTGVSLLTAVELAEMLGLDIDENAFTVFDLYQAEEAMLTASTYCLLPVVKVNGLPFGDGKPGRSWGNCCGRGASWWGWTSSTRRCAARTESRVHAGRRAVGAIENRPILQASDGRRWCHSVTAS
jgi:branched-chain amino acid aminotransferase